MRLFIALHLAGNIRNQLSRLQAELRTADAAGEVRWVDPEAMHLTLRFLGETPEATVPGLITALGAHLGKMQRIRLGLTGIGGFPNLKRPRVVWVGLGGDLVALGSLQRQVESAVIAVGWPAENRPFQPHLTVGRVRNPGRSLRPKLETVIGSVRIETRVEVHARVALVRSHLSPAGSRYEDLSRWDFGP